MVLSAYGESNLLLMTARLPPGTLSIWYAARPEGLGISGTKCSFAAEWIVTTNTLACPRCGASNRADAMNCVACRINIAFALENPAEIERIRRENARRDRLGNMVVSASTSRDRPIMLPVLLLLGSFAFAFCLGEAVHELGHFLAHRAYGVEVGIKLDPFGGSRILNGSSAPREIWGITSAAGPLLNLVTGVALSLLVWPHRRPALLPLLLWGPIALVQEGVTFSLGILTPGGDAQLIVGFGILAPVVLGLGVLFLGSGAAAVCWVLPLVNLSPSDAFGRRFTVVAGGMVTFMAVRLVGSCVSSPHLAQENAVPLAFALLLATIVAALYGHAHCILRRPGGVEPASVRWSAGASAAALAMGMVLFQLTSFN